MLNPLMLFGLLGLAVPVVIHLIQRQRLRPQPLATLAFLDREDTANAFAPVPKDLLQLLLRLLLMACFILLMSRLVGCGRTPGPRTMTVVLDQSLGMQQVGPDGCSLFETSRAQILALIEALRPEDRMSLVLVGDRTTVETGFLSDRARLRATAESCVVSDGGGLGLVPAIRAAVDQLRGRRDVNAAVLVFSGHRRGHYEHALAEARQAGRDENRTQAFRRRLERGRVQLVFVAPAAPPGDNLAIESGAFTPPQVFLGSSARFSARVHNYATNAQTAQLTFFEDGRGGGRRAVTVAPDETVTVDLVHVFESPVDAACQVELGEDGLPGDNRFHLPMRMRDRRQVLLVTPHAEEAGDSLALRARGADLFFYALNPGEALGRGAGTFVTVRRVTPAALEQLSLPFYAAVVFYGVDLLSARAQADLAAYVDNGGGLYLIPGDGIGPARFNQAFASVLGSFALGQEVVHDPGLPLETRETRLDDPLLAPLGGGEWGDVRSVSFRRYHGVDTAGDARVLLRAGNDDPLAVRLARGRGQVFVQLFSCSLAAGSLPRSSAFVPMVQTVLGALRPASADDRSESLRVGEALRLPVPAWRGLDGPGELAGIVTNRLAVQADGETPYVRVDGLLHAGAYALTHPGHHSGRRRWVTVNPVAGESDLTPLGADEQALLFGTRRFAQVPAQELADVFAQRRELAGWMLALLLPAFVAEALAGAWQSRRRPPSQPRRGQQERAA